MALNKIRVGGFTLIEVMVTIAVAGIMISIAAPAMNNFIQDGKLTSQANNFVAALRATRGESIKRGAVVDLERKGGDWANGWEVQDSTDAVLLQWSGNSRINATAASGNSISFRASGIRTDIGADFVIKFCDSRNKGRRITVKGLGGITSTCWIGYPGRASVCAADSGCAAIP